MGRNGKNGIAYTMLLGPHILLIDSGISFIHIPHAQNWGFIRLQVWEKFPTNFRVVYLYIQEKIMPSLLLLLHNLYNLLFLILFKPNQYYYGDEETCPLQKLLCIKVRLKVLWLVMIHFWVRVYQSVAKVASNVN